MARKKLHYSFEPCLNNIKAGDIKEIREKLIEVLDIKSRRDYFIKRRDYVNIPAHYKKWVEDVFKEYDVDNNIWSITDDDGKNINI